MENPIPNSEIELKRESLSKFLGARGVTEIELLDPEILTRNSNDLIGNIEILETSQESLGAKLQSAQTDGERDKILKIIKSRAKVEKSVQETRDIMEKLGLSPEDEIKIEKRTIRFKEDVGRGEVGDIFPDRPKDQEITFYLYRPKNLTDESDVIVGVYSHGFSMKEEFSLHSNFPAMIHNFAEKSDVPVLLGTFDHRGSTEETKSQYSLYDRVTDVAVVELAMLGQDVLGKDRKGNVKVSLLGNSVGGSIVAMASSDLHPDDVIMSQPSAYVAGAERKPIGDEFSKAIRVPEGWRNSPAFISLGKYLQRGGHALVIGALKDQAIPEGVINGYTKELLLADYLNNKSYLRDVSAAYAQTTEKIIGAIWIDASHESTTYGELEAIVAQLKTGK